MTCYIKRQKKTRIELKRPWVHDIPHENKGEIKKKRRIKEESQHIKTNEGFHVCWTFMCAGLFMWTFHVA